MLPVAIGAAVLVAVVVLCVNVQGRRFERRVRREACALLSDARPPAASPSAGEGLPPPVRRYLAMAGALGRAPVGAVHVRHGGTFVPKPGGAPLAIRGEQWLTADPPGFVWWGRIRIAPGVWIDGRDRVVRGEGNMLVRAVSSFTLADARGPALDEGALLRLLGELTWLPTALLDGRHVSWAPQDERSARATLRVGGREASAVFHFGPDGMPERFTAERYRDVDGEGVLTPFTGALADFRVVGGVRVPFRLAATWHLADQDHTYARWEVEEVALEPPAPG